MPESEDPGEEPSPNAGGSTAPARGKEATASPPDAPVSGDSGEPEEESSFAGEMGRLFMIPAVIVAPVFV